MRLIQWWHSIGDGGQVVVVFLTGIGGMLAWTVYRHYFPKRCPVCRTPCQERLYSGYSEHITWYCPTCKVELG